MAPNEIQTVELIIYNPVWMCTDIVTNTSHMKQVKF